MMEPWWQAFWLGVMVAYSPGMLLLALILMRQMEDKNERS